MNNYEFNYEINLLLQVYQYANTKLMQGINKSRHEHPIDALLQIGSIIQG